MKQLSDHLARVQPLLRRPPVGESDDDDSDRDEWRRSQIPLEELYSK